MEDSTIRLEQKLCGHLERVWCVRWHPNGRWLASCGADRVIRIWALDGKKDDDSDPKWKCLSILEDAHERTIRCISWSHDGRFLASASFDGTTCIWHHCENLRDSYIDNDSKNKWSILVSLEGHENEVKCVSWSPSNTYLATCSRDKSVWIWEKIEVKHSSNDNYSKEPLPLASEGEEEAIFECASVQTEHNQDVKCVKWHPMLDILVSSSFDNMINFYCQGDDDWNCYAQLCEHESTVWSVDFNKHGSRLVSVSADETIKIWQPIDYNQLIEEIGFGQDGDKSIGTKRYAELTSKWTIIASLSGYHRWPIYDVSWSPYLNCILTVGADNSIHVFKEISNDKADKFSPVRYRQVCHKSMAHEQDINSVDWNQSQKLSNMFATGSDDGCVHIWKFSSSQ